MALYETTFIVRQDATKADVTKLADDFAKIITDAKGKIVKNEYWGLRTLAYVINKNRKGHYAHIAHEAETDAIKELDRKLRLNENVIRHMTVVVEEHLETPSSAFAGSSNYDEAA